MKDGCENTNRILNSGLKSTIQTSVINVDHREKCLTETKADN